MEERKHNSNFFFQQFSILCTMFTCIFFFSNIYSPVEGKKKKKKDQNNTQITNNQSHSSNQNSTDTSWTPSVVPNHTLRHPSASVHTCFTGRVFLPAVNFASTVTALGGELE